MLTRDEARTFYDAFGARQDKQGFYEDLATAELVAHAAFEEATSVFELGCGTGRFAAELLEHHLPATATYRGCDLSSTMIDLARARLASYGNRARVDLSDGSPHVDAAAATFDRFVSNYVLDLLPGDDIAAIMHEAWRVLAPGGLLCLVSLTRGNDLRSRFVSGAWSLLHRLRASLVGGCRPIELQHYLASQLWHVEYRAVVTPYGIPSEIVVARKPM